MLCLGLCYSVLTCHHISEMMCFLIMYVLLSLSSSLPPSLSSSPSPCLLVSSRSQSYLSLPLSSPGISSVLFESRLGCLDPLVPVETERFIQSINTMFVMTLLTMAMPKWMHQLFPKPWDTFCRCWDYMFQFGESCLPRHKQI